jgi:hypothetical protein
MKKVFVLFMALLMIGAAGGMAAGTGGGSAARDTIPVRAEVSRDVAAIGDVFVMAQVLELPERPDSFFTLANGFYGKGIVVQEVSPAAGCSGTAVRGTTV